MSGWPSALDLNQLLTDTPSLLEPSIPSLTHSDRVDVHMEQNLVSTPQPFGSPQQADMCRDICCQRPTNRLSETSLAAQINSVRRPSMPTFGASDLAAPGLQTTLEDFLRLNSAADVGVIPALMPGSNETAIQLACVQPCVDLSTPGMPCTAMQVNAARRFSMSMIDSAGVMSSLPLAGRTFQPPPPPLDLNGNPVYGWSPLPLPLLPTLPPTPADAMDSVPSASRKRPCSPEPASKKRKTAHDAADADTIKATTPSAAVSESSSGTDQNARKDVKPGQHQCTHCKKYFTRPSSLSTHMHTHTGEKPHACLFPGCHKRFSVLSNLRRHTKIHDEARIREIRKATETYPATLPYQHIHVVPPFGTWPGIHAPYFEERGMLPMGSLMGPPVGSLTGPPVGSPMGLPTGRMPDVCGGSVGDPVAWLASTLAAHDVAGGP